MSFSLYYPDKLDKGKFVRILKAILFVSVLCLGQTSWAKDYTPEECPVIGNTHSHIFHVPGGRSYAKMLRQNKQGDNRQCFQSEAAAEKAGYRRSRM
jgi:hypothetical protein